MNVKAFLCGTLVVAVLGVRSAAAQELTPPTYTDQGPQSTLDGEVPPDHIASPGSLSSWITYIKPNCCGHTGIGGLIGNELYLRAGWSIPWQGGVLRNVAETGWMVQGGGRLLFFNEPLDRAWTADVSLSNTWNHGQRDDIPITLILRDTNNPGQFVTQQVTLRSLNRTCVNLTGGREYYGRSLLKGCDGGWNWRWGWDAGGRYGTMRADLDEFGMRSFFRRNDVIGGVLFSLHSDVEVPCGCCTWQGGIRAEISYTWSDIFQAQNNADLLDVNLLLTLGVRF